MIWNVGAPVDSDIGCTDSSFDINNEYDKVKEFSNDGSNVGAIVDSEVNFEVGFEVGSADASKDK